ncbi:hypothetical protein [Variovorax sp.]|uniref:hypothetical protein n=1 Tax=Variovorax sp. TaxID=1871043 RepID=UPI002D4F8D0C|nr:hypothetical protein [Variovorax sp.]HYP85057.1 hypothetical protein [Variovorax sp.]
MNIAGRAALAAGLLLPALIAGVYGAGWLVMWLLNVPGRLDALTYWHYAQSIDLAAFQPFADKIRLAGYIGFGVPLLVWVGTVVALLWGLRLDDLFDLSEPTRPKQEGFVSGTAPVQQTPVNLRRPGGGPHGEEAQRVVRFHDASPTRSADHAADSRKRQPARTSLAAPTHLPPVPPALREMLKDYPEHIEEIQRSLNDVAAKPLKGTPVFEQALWALEGALGSFIDEAQEELRLAEASGDPQAIENARQKRHLMFDARGERDWDDLWEFFEGNRGASA